MKAIQVEQVGGPEALQLAEVPVPEPKANEAVVKLAASGVNFIDVYFREGRYKTTLPFTPGQEGAGEVVAIGKDVTSLKNGDRVAHLLDVSVHPLNGREIFRAAEELKEFFDLRLSLCNAFLGCGA